MALYDYEKDPGSDPEYCNALSDRRRPIDAAKEAFGALERTIGLLMEIRAPEIQLAVEHAAEDLLKWIKRKGQP